jgi:cyanophycinase
VAKERNGGRKRKAAQAPGLAAQQTPLTPSSRNGSKGSLIIIGGHEDKEGERRILQEVRARAARGKLVVATVATAHPQEVWAEYRAVFRKLGMKSIEHLDVESREDAFAEEKVAVLQGAGAVFFTGGDQLRITSRMGGSPACERIREIFERGGTIAGTSAGASAMSDTMLVAGPSDQSNKAEAVQMAPGLGLINGVIVDQHFAERGRLGRLVGAVAQNPRLLGVGIDEDTAVVAEATRLSILGSGAVYVVDGMRESYTNVSEEERGEVVSVFDLRLHILSDGDAFDLETRRPVRGTRAQAG